MKNTVQILKALERMGYRLEHGKGSIIKIYPPKGPFYSFHNGEKGLHPLRRFAKKNWGVDLENV